MTACRSRLCRTKRFLRIACLLVLGWMIGQGQAAHAGLITTGFLDLSPAATSSSDLAFLQFNGKDLVIDVFVHNQSHLTPGTGNGVDPVPATLTPGASIQVNLFCSDPGCTFSTSELTNVQCTSLQA